MKTTRHTGRTLTRRKPYTKQSKPYQRLPASVRKDILTAAQNGEPTVLIAKRLNLRYNKVYFTIRDAGIDPVGLRDIAERSAKQGDDDDMPQTLFDAQAEIRRLRKELEAWFDMAEWVEAV